MTSWYYSLEIHIFLELVCGGGCNILCDVGGINSNKGQSFFCYNNENTFLKYGRPSSTRVLGQRVGAHVVCLYRTGLVNTF